MDITKYKSVAVRAENYNLLKGLCKKKYRTPGAFIEKLIADYITFQANKENKTEIEYKLSLLDDQ